MVLGFNHNIRYRGELFHVQTEDSGRANPHIITLLYRGGTIIASAKTSYADIIKVDQLEMVVESIMKDQHKEMMRRLKGGDFDARIFPGQAAAPSASDAPEASVPAAPAPATAPTAVVGTAASAAPSAAAAAPAAAPRPAAPAATAPQPAAPAAAPVTPLRPVPAAAPRPPAEPQAATASREPSPRPTDPPAPPAKRSLDEVILDYLITGEEK